METTDYEMSLELLEVAGMFARAAVALAAGDVISGNLALEHARYLVERASEHMNVI